MAIIQARLGSTRLPNKVLAPILGKPMLQHVVERVKKAKRIDDVVVAFPHKDAKLADAVYKLGVWGYPGDELDVLKRYYDCAKRFEADHVVRITADCPLMDPVLIDYCIEEHLRSGADYTSNVIVRTFPDGLDVEVFTMEALAHAHEEATEPEEREHVTTYLRNPINGFSHFIVTDNEHSPFKDRSYLRWTVDTAEDLAHVEQMMKDGVDEEGYELPKF